MAEMDDRSACAWTQADRWLSVDETCEHLGIGKDTVYKWIDKHDMPAHRMGRLWKFKKDVVKVNAVQIFKQVGIVEVRSL